MKTALRLLALAFATASIGSAQTIEQINQTLARPVQEYKSQGQEATDVFDGIGRLYQIPIIVEPEVKGPVSFRVYNANVALLLEAICSPKGWSYEVVPTGQGGLGYLAVRQFITKTYSIDYLQATQTGSSSASVSLSSGSGTSGGNYGNGGVMALGTNSTNGTTGGTSASGAGASSISVTSTNDADFWTRFEADVKAMLRDGERVTINKFGGLVKLTGSSKTHAELEAYISKMMSRVRRQVDVEVSIVSVDLNDSFKAGIDWNTAIIKASSLGGHTSFGPFSTDSSSHVNALGGVALPGSTFQGTISSGKVSAVIDALKEQGTTEVTSKPRISILNNTTGFIQLTDDVPFFQRTNSTIYNASSVTTTSPISQSNYSEKIISFGNVLECTPQISDNDETQMVIQPSITEQKDTIISPDGQQTDAKTGVRRLRSVVTLRDGESYVLGGFISESKGKKTSGVPLLSEIPYAGRLFRSESEYKQRTEVAVIVTVHVKSPLKSKPEEVVVPTAGKLGAGEKDKGAVTDKNAASAERKSKDQEAIDKAQHVAGSVVRVGP